MLIDDTEKQQYRVALEGEYSAVAKYTLQDKVMTLYSTHVPEELQGKGYGKVMMEAILPEIERQGYTIIPSCSYVAHYINRNAKWQHLLAN